MTERYISACESHEDVFLPTMGTMVLDEEDHRLQDAVRRFRENSDTKQRPLWEAFWELVDEFDLTEEQIQKVKGYLEDERDE